MSSRSIDEQTKKIRVHLKLSISVAIVSSSVFEELLGIPYPICLKDG